MNLKINIMKNVIIVSFLVGLLNVSCNDRATGNGADDKPDKGPYQYKNENTDTDSTANKQ